VGNVESENGSTICHVRDDVDFHAEVEEKAEAEKN
jgi:hypothetical protein